MSTQTVQTTGVAASPRVNLMPPEIAEAERFRRLQLAMGGAVVVSALAVGMLYQHAKSNISSAQSDLTSAQAQQGALQSKLSSLSNVSQTFASVNAKQSLLQQAMGAEIRWSYMLNDLTFRIPSNVWLTGLQATETGPGGALATTSTATSAPALPTSPTSIGTIAFNGVAFKHDDVATWLDSLAKEKGYTNPTFSSSTEAQIGSRTVVNFSTAVEVTLNALSNRYINKAGS